MNGQTLRQDSGVTVKKKAGRPKWIPGYEQIDEIKTMAENGLTEGQIAESMGVCQDTFIERKKEYPEIVEALQKGKASGINRVSNALFEAASGGNITAQIFYLKCRAGWKETSVTELANKDGEALKLQAKSEVTITSELIKSRIDDIMAKRG